MTDDFAAEIRALEDPKMARPRRTRAPQKARTKANRHLEDDLSRAVNVLFERIFDQKCVVWYAIPNGGNRDPREAGRLRAQGVKAGVLDWSIHWLDDDTLHPMTGAIELKIGNNKPSDEQQAFAERMARIGHKVGCCRSLDEVIAIIRAWNVPHRRIS